MEPLHVNMVEPGVKTQVQCFSVDCAFISPCVSLRVVLSDLEDCPDGCDGFFTYVIAILL